MFSKIFIPFWAQINIFCPHYVPKMYPAIITYLRPSGIQMHDQSLSISTEI